MGWSWRRTRTVPRHALSSPAPVPRPVPAPVPVPEPAPTSGRVARGVLLGFADGSEVAFAEGDPRAAALQAVAEVLARRDG